MPSTLLSMAFWMKVDCVGTSPELEYLNSTLSLSAASWAPFLMTSKNASPSGACEIMAMVRRFEVGEVDAPPSSGRPRCCCMRRVARASRGDADDTVVSGN